MPPSPHRAPRAPPALVRVRVRVRGRVRVRVRIRVSVRVRLRLRLRLRVRVSAQLVEHAHQRRRVLVELAARLRRVDPGARVHRARKLARAHVLVRVRVRVS